MAADTYTDRGRAFMNQGKFAAAKADYDTANRLLKAGK
jgi:hypothetical protein